GREAHDRQRPGGRGWTGNRFTREDGANLRPDPHGVSGDLESRRPAEEGSRMGQRILFGAQPRRRASRTRFVRLAVVLALAVPTAVISVSSGAGAVDPTNAFELDGNITPVTKVDW